MVLPCSRICERSLGHDVYGEHVVDSAGLFKILGAWWPDEAILDADVDFVCSWSWLGTLEVSEWVFWRTS